MPDPISSVIGIGTGIIGAIGNLFGNKKANRDLKRLQSEDPVYQNSMEGIANQNLSQQRLGLAQTLLNSKMPGSSAIDRGIYAGYGNQAGNISRNATSGSQALALGAANVGQANDAFMQQGENQANWYRGNLQNLNQAQEGLANENRFGFEDTTRRFQDKAQIQGAMAANRRNTWSSIENLGGGIANFGMNGGMSGIFGGGGGNSGGIGTNAGQINPYTKTVGNIPQGYV